VLRCFSDVRRQTDGSCRRSRSPKHTVNWASADAGNFGALLNAANSRVAVNDRATDGKSRKYVCLSQCRINYVADVENATGLRPQGGLRKFFSARQ